MNMYVVWCIHRQNGLLATGPYEWAPIFSEARTRPAGGRAFKEKETPMAVRVLQGAQEDIMRRSLEKKWIAQLKKDDRTKVINRVDGADIL